MALGKYARVDGKKSSNYCSTVSIVVFVAVCLVGVWMMTSSSVVPVQNSDVASQQDSQNDVNEKARVSDNSANDNNSDNASSESQNDSSESSSNENESKLKQFEDNPGDLADDARKGDNNVSLNQESKNSSSQEKPMEENQDKPREENKEEGGSASEDGSKTQTENGENMESKSDQKDFEAGETNESNAGGGDSVGDNKSGEDSDESKNADETNKKGTESDQDSSEKTENGQTNEVFPSGSQSELLNETTTQNGSFSTQASESKNEKEAQKSSEPQDQGGYSWKLCNVTAGTDYIPCLDNFEAIRNLRTTKHYEHRERHCPDDPPTCLVSLPEGYQRSIEWPTSREKIWYHNVPHTKLAEIKGHQNWVKVTGEYLTFPGGGTQFKHGALHYIDFIQQSVPNITWGKQTRVVLDVGCGVASFGGFLFDRDVLTMSLAPKDEHEAQVQFALERGIPAISAVMGTKRLPFPGRVFDVVHCARCRVPWHIEGGKLLLELNRLLRPGGYFIWSATPVYQKIPVDVEIWEVMKNLTKSMCWDVVSIIKDRLNGVGIAIYQKPTNNECYKKRSQNEPALCLESDDPNAAWNVPLQACMHKVPVNKSERRSQWPEAWPSRLDKPPYWLLSSQVGVYGKPAPEDFTADFAHWKHVVTNSYVKSLGINWATVRNVMDMRAVYGGFAAALKDMKVWVMNIISIDAPDTLPIIYERGLFGIYHDWCESFSTYPRSYDLLHADHLFSKIKKKCNFNATIAEADRILRPEGTIIVRDTVETVNELEGVFKSLHWEIRMTYSQDKEGLLCAQKTMWRPKESETLSYAIS